MLAYVWVKGGTLLRYGGKSEARHAARLLRQQGLIVTRSTRTGIV